MSTETPLRCVPTDIEALFGDPPLLSTEDPNLYWDMFDRFAEFVDPKNIIEWLWLKDIVDLCWEIARLRRYRALLIERERESKNAEIDYAREHAGDRNPSWLERLKRPQGCTGIVAQRACSSRSLAMTRRRGGLSRICRPSSR